MVPEVFRELLCHGENVTHKPNGILMCGECGHEINVYAFIEEHDHKNIYRSSLLGDVYAHWIGDVDVKCKIPIMGLPGILPKMVSTTLSRLWIATRLLREVTSPFVASKPLTATHKRERIIENFLGEYLKLVDESADDSNVSKTVCTILRNMKDMIGGGPDLFERYFTLVVPYVKKCAGEVGFPAATEGQSPAETFVRESTLATSIREQYSKYCIPFDVIYVMIYCYICANDTDVLSNLVFDLTARASCGYFSVPGGATEFDKSLRSILNSETCTREFYHMIRRIQKGEGSDILSREFIEKYGKLDLVVSKRFFISGDTECMRFAYSQNFPYVMFTDRGNDDDYFGFIVSLGHLINKWKSYSGNLPKDAISQARAMYRFVKRFSEQMREYSSTFGGDHFYWTNDTFEVFLATSGLEEKFLNLVDIFVKN